MTPESDEIATSSAEQEELRARLAFPEAVHLFVEPDCVGQGIGRALWQHALAIAAGLGHRTLTVVADPNAAGFYRRMGAEPAGGQASDLEPGRILPVFPAATAVALAAPGQSV